MASGHKRVHDDNLLPSASSSKKPRSLQDELAPTDSEDIVNDVVLSVMKSKSNAVIGEDLPEQDRLTLFETIIKAYRVEYEDSSAYCVVYYKYAAELLKENVAFLGLTLDEAWKEGSFTQITSSAFFQRGPVLNMQLDGTVTSQIDATEKAWKCSFKGVYAELLKDTILKERYEAKTLTVIQSSGTGKSRTVYEVGKSLFSVYINLREATGSGYPSRDPALCDFIADADRYRYDCLTTKKNYCVAFLRGIFEAAISLLGTDDLSPEAFRERLFNQRSGFDALAAKKAKEYLLKIPWETSLEDYDGLLRDVKSTIDRFATAAKLSKHSNVVLLAIDECHTMNREGGDSSTYHALCQVLRDLLGSSEPYLFVVLVSTSLQRRRVAPTPAHDPASRVVMIKTEVDAYTAFPFDVETDVIVEDTKTVDEVCELRFLCSFGRPLWLSRYEGGNRYIEQNLVRFAKAKLHGNEQFEEHTDESMFAALSTRFLLTFERGGVTDDKYQKLSEFEYKQVAMHMRIVHSIPSHGRYIRTGTPSEPILAEAAAQLFPDGRKQLKFLADRLDPLFSWPNLLVSKGKRGELAARLLCDLAHDATVLNLPRSTSGDDILYSRPISLIAFLEALINPQFHSIVLDSCPSKGGVPLREAFKESCVHFTHWAKMGDASCLSTKALWKAVARGVAWQCCDDMAGVDQIVPIILDHREKLGRGNVSALVIRDQDVACPILTCLNDDFGPTLFADAPGGIVRPYIYLTMRLGLEATRQQRFPPSSTPTTWQYDITITGCSSKVYRVIHDDDRCYWDQLLFTRQVLEEEHTRKHDPRHLELLKRSKPFFWGSEGASFDWARDSDDMQADEEGQEPWDIVTAGLEE